MAARPSAASRLASTAWFQPSSACAAASREARSAARAEASAAWTASGAFAAISRAISTARSRCWPVGNHLGDEAGVQRGVGVEELGGEEVSHAGGPEAGGQPERRAAQREDPARHLELREARALGGDGDLGRQCQLDAERVADAVHRNDDRLRARLAEEVPRIEAVLRKHRAGVAVGDQRCHRRQIEPGGEQPAVSEDHADAEVVGSAEPPVRRGDRLDHLEVPEVVGLGPVTPMSSSGPSSSMVTGSMVMPPAPRSASSRAAQS